MGVFHFSYREVRFMPQTPVAATPSRAGSHKRG